MSLDQSGASGWPSFKISSPESMIALAAVVVKYTELEAILIYMFSILFDMEREDAQIVVAKTGAGNATAIMESKLRTPMRLWDPERKEAIAHFLSGFSACAENRHNMMHSELKTWDWTPEHALNKVSKQGNFIGVKTTLEEMRKVSEEMHVYIEYGKGIGAAVTHAPSALKCSAHCPLPEKPALPHRLAYKLG
jgi:hypothetical protein